MIRVFISNLPSASKLQPYLDRMDRTKVWCNFGTFVDELEMVLAARFSNISGGSSRYATTVSSGTLGLELALTALKLPAGSKVLVPAFTFPATASAVVRAGHVPIFADVDADSWMLTPEIAYRVVPEGMKSNLAAIIPVCAFGARQHTEGWERYQESTGIKVVIDAAAAYDNQNTSHLFPTVFSLHGTKSLAAGEGGFIISGNLDFKCAIRNLSNFGLNSHRLSVVQGSTNAKLSELHAAMALASIEKHAEILTKYIEVKNYYNEWFRKTGLDNSLSFQKQDDDEFQIAMPVLLPKRFNGEVPRIQAALATKDIETRQWYCPPLFIHPAFAHFQNFAGKPSTTYELATRLLGLPFHTYLTEDDVHKICHELAAAIYNHG